MAHIHHPLPIPSAENPDLDPRLDTILTKALAKDPDDRYPNLGEFLREMNSVAGVTEPQTSFEFQATMIQEAVPPPADMGVPPPADVGGIAQDAEPTRVAPQSAPTPKISMDQSRVLAMRTARENPGAYGRGFTDVPMAFDVVAEEETDDHYVVTLSFRPQGAFNGTPGQEQFFIDKTGTVAHRQVLSLPIRETKERNLLLPAVGGAVVVVAAVAVVAVLLLTGGSSDDAPPPAAGGDGAAPGSAPPAAGAPSVPGGATQAPAAPAVVPAPAPGGAAPAVVGARRGEGTAVISDDQDANDAITYAMSGVTPPPGGKVYVGWLVSDDGSVVLNTGAMAVQPDGSIDHVFNRTSNSYTGQDLVHNYGKAMITEEDAGAALERPPGAEVFSHEIPAGALAHIRHLLTNWPAGSDKGILTNLKEQLVLAHSHAIAAAELRSLPDIRRQLEQVVNIIDGATGPNFGDLDGNGAVENPGDGQGVLLHAADRKHAGFAAGVAPDDPVVTGRATFVDAAGKNAADMAVLARDKALEALAAGDADLATALVGPGENTVVGMLDVALNGTGSVGGAVQAYIEAQRMATYTLKSAAGAAGALRVSQITYALPQGRIFRVLAQEGAAPEDISASLDALSPDGPDDFVNTSPNGQWLVVSAHRFDEKCETWACIAIVAGDLSSGGAIHLV